MVIELKVAGLNGGRTDAPPLALMEGLRYAAIVEANLEIIAGEAERRFGAKVARLPPVVQLLAPESWWRSWLELRAAGIWGPAFARLIAAVEAQTGLIISCMALEEAHVIQGLGGWAPRYEHVPALYPVRPGDASPIGAALPPLASVGNAMSSYGVVVNQHLWTWATQHVAEILDRGSRPGRPPVLKPEFADMNVLVPSDAAQRAQIRTAVRFNQRHRHFASLRSSQALTQSVFGAISAAGRLDLLAGITAECGRPAFFTTGDDHWKLEFEHNVATLGERQPTSIDVMLSGPDRCVAIECKFTESEFGTCSRPRLRPGEPGWCDGSYRVQEGRRNRCALAEIGIQYWDHLPGSSHGRRIETTRLALLVPFISWPATHLQRLSDLEVLLTLRGDMPWLCMTPAILRFRREAWPIGNGNPLSQLAACPACCGASAGSACCPFSRLRRI